MAMPGHGVGRSGRRQWIMGSLAAMAWLNFARCLKQGDASEEFHIFVAASMAPFMRAVAKRVFSNQEIRSILNVAGSHQLASQLMQGASADLFISANRSQMDRVTTNRKTIKVFEIARNELILVVHREQSKKVRSVFDLEQRNLRVVMGIEAVPVGHYARQALGRLRLREAIEARVVSFEHDVRGIVMKVNSQEVDAGFIYRSDLIHQSSNSGTENLVEVPLPPQARLFASYYAAVLHSQRRQLLSDRMIAFLLGAAGRSLLREHGFIPLA